MSRGPPPAPAPARRVPPGGRAADLPRALRPPFPPRRLPSLPRATAPEGANYFDVVFVREPLAVVEERRANRFPTSRLGACSRRCGSPGGIGSFVAMTSHLESLREGSEERKRQLAEIARRLRHRGRARRCSQATPTSATPRRRECSTGLATHGRWSGSPAEARAHVGPRGDAEHPRREGMACVAVRPRAVERRVAGHVTRRRRPHRRSRAQTDSGPPITSACASRSQPDVGVHGRDVRHGDPIAAVGRERPLPPQEAVGVRIRHARGSRSSSVLARARSPPCRSPRRGCAP